MDYPTTFKELLPFNNVAYKDYKEGVNKTILKPVLLILFKEILFQEKK